MNIRISNEQARILAALLKDEAAVGRAIQASVNDPIPNEAALQTALTEVEAGTADGPMDDGPPLSEEELGMVSPAERTSAQFSRDLRRRQHFARTRTPLRESAAGPTETECQLATALIRRKPGLSFARACRIVAGK